MSDVDAAIAEIRLLLGNIRRSSSFVRIGQLTDEIEMRLRALESLQRSRSGASAHQRM